MYIHTQVSDEGSINLVVYGLILKNLQCNIAKALVVNSIYFRFKTFKSFQALLNLSKFKNTE